MLTLGAKSTRRTGFSLIEFMVVIAVLAILFAVSAPLFAGLRARLAVSEGANQFARDVERQRQESRRQTSSTQIANIVAGGTEYTLVATDGAPTVRALPAGVAFGAAAESTVSFVGPYGTVAPVNPATLYTLVWSRDEGVTVDVAIVGVLGKAIVR